MLSPDASLATRWLQTSLHLLEEGDAPGLSSGERLRLLGKTARHLDDFVVRFGLWLSSEAATGAGGDAGIRETFGQLSRGVQDQWRDLRSDLGSEGLVVAGAAELTRTERIWVERHLTNEILGAVTPLAVHPSRPFPRWQHLGVTLVCEVIRHRDRCLFDALLPIPRGLERFILLQDSRKPSRVTVVPLEHALEIALPHLFPNCAILPGARVRVLRGAGLTSSEGGEAVLPNVLPDGPVARFEVDGRVPERLMRILEAKLGLEPTLVHQVEGMLALRDLHMVAERCGPNPVSGRVVA